MVGGGHEKLGEVDLPGAVGVDGVDDVGDGLLVHHAVDGFVGLD